jgi:glycosyltransferase involved in cell wall biosynthesis
MVSQNKRGRDGHMIRVAHVITGLGTGGAQMMLHKLLAHSHRTTAEHSVFSLMPDGDLASSVRALGVAVTPLGMRAGVPDPRALLRLARLLQLTSVDIVQTWMYHGDLVGGLAARMAGIPVVWGVHHAALDPTASRRGTRLVQHICARLSSRIPTAIVACSHEALKVHVRVGYAADRFIVIPNGFDLDMFHPDATAGRSLRRILGISTDGVIVGHVARWDKNKDYPNLARAARTVIQRRPDTHFALIGHGITHDNKELSGILAAEGLSSDPRVHLMGQRKDVPALMPGFDVLCQSSLSEASPNVIGEAMACAVPCAVTDVGDSARLVGDCGRVAPARDAEALAGALLSLIDLAPTARWQLGSNARARIAEQYSVDRVAGEYLSLYGRVAAQRT